MQHDASACQRPTERWHILEPFIPEEATALDQAEMIEP